MIPVNARLEVSNFRKFLIEKIRERLPLAMNWIGFQDLPFCPDIIGASKLDLETKESSRRQLLVSRLEDMPIDALAEVYDELMRLRTIRETDEFIAMQSPTTEGTIVLVRKDAPNRRLPMEEKDFLTHVTDVRFNEWADKKLPRNPIRDILGAMPDMPAEVKESLSRVAMMP